MYARTTLPESARRLLAEQAGVISYRQAAGCGMSRESFRRHAKEWTRLSPGLYLASEPTWEAAAWAGLVQGGHEAVLGGAAACHLHGLISRPPEQLTIWTSRQHRRLAVDPYGVTFRRGERLGRGQLTRTHVEDSILDLAGEVEASTLIEATTRAFADQKTTPSRLLGMMVDRRRQSQRPLLEALCDPRNQGIQSVLEWLFEMLVIRPHQFGALQRQARLTRGSRVDVYFEGYNLIVELDGRSFHDADRDALRDNAHALQLGAVTLRFTWYLVLHEPCAVAATIARALRVRGWEEGLRRCKSCPPMF